MAATKNSIPIYRKNGIVSVLTKNSTNKKTGPMLQVAHLAEHKKPTQLIKDKEDPLVCGDCPLKASLGGPCYVNPISLNGKWQAVQGVDTVPESEIPIDHMRLGEYGESVKGLTLSFVGRLARRLKRKRKKRVGYTHQWDKISTKWAQYLMASIDTLKANQLGLSLLETKSLANKKGYRTYRIIEHPSEVLSDEILCPYYTKGVQCYQCGLCAGRQIQAKNIAVILHGAPNKIATYQKRSTSHA